MDHIQRPWIAINRLASPTPASAALRKALADIDADIIDLGQGREQSEFDLAKKIIRAQGSIEISSDYNSPPRNLNKAAARWLHDLLGVDAFDTTTFSIQQGGRNGLDAACHVLALQARSAKADKILMPELSWPMIGEILADSGFSEAVYSMDSGNCALNIKQQLEECGDKVAAVYLNSPHNPSGRILTTQDFDEIFSVLNDYNSGEKLARRDGRKIGIIMDAPYPHACPEIIREGRRALDTGFEVFTQAQPTPWFMPVSTSKFFGMASPGFTMMAVHGDYVSSLTGRLMRSSGIWYTPPLFAALEQILDPQNDGLCLDHFAMLREKYQKNRMTLERAFPKQALAGKPGMLAILRMDMSDYLGKVMQRHDGSDFVVQDGAAMIEYLANKHGVVCVYQGEDIHTGAGLLRFSLAESPERFQAGIARVMRGLHDVCPIPKLANGLQVPQEFKILAIK